MTTKLLILRPKASISTHVEKEEIPYFFVFIIVIMINDHYYVFIVTNGEFSAVRCCQ